MQGLGALLVLWTLVVLLARVLAVLVALEAA